MEAIKITYMLKQILSLSDLKKPEVGEQL